MRRVLFLLAAVALLAGCGGGGGSSKGGEGGPSGPPLTKAAYQAKLQAISKEIGDSIGSSTNNGKKIAKEDVDKFVDAAHRFADRLGEVNPPAEVKELHAELVQAMDDLGDEFPDIADKLNNASKEDASGAIAALLGAHAVQELIKVGEGFKKKGYKLDLNGS